MPEQRTHPCIDCFNKKIKIFLDIEKAKSEAQKKANEEGKTYAVCQDEKKYFAKEAALAREEGDYITELFLNNI